MRPGMVHTWWRGWLLYSEGVVWARPESPEGAGPSAGSLRVPIGCRRGYVKRAAQRGRRKALAVCIPINKEVERRWSRRPPAVGVGRGHVQARGGRGPHAASQARGPPAERRMRPHSGRGSAFRAMGRPSRGSRGGARPPPPLAGARSQRPRREARPDRPALVGHRDRHVDPWNIGGLRSQFQVIGADEGGHQRLGRARGGGGPGGRGI
jgi:hypothetical protein